MRGKYQTWAYPVVEEGCRFKWRDYSHS